MKHYATWCFYLAYPPTSPTLQLDLIHQVASHPTIKPLIERLRVEWSPEFITSPPVVLIVLLSLHRHLGLLGGACRHRGDCLHRRHHVALGRGWGGFLRPCLLGGGFLRPCLPQGGFLHPFLHLCICFVDDMLCDGSCGLSVEQLVPYRYIILPPAILASRPVRRLTVIPPISPVPPTTPPRPVRCLPPCGLRLGVHIL